MSSFLKNILHFLSGKTPIGITFVEREREREKRRRYISLYCPGFYCNYSKIFSWPIRKNT